DHRVHGRGHQGGVELELAGEVLVEHRLGDARAFGDLVHRGRVIPLLDEHLEGDVEQLSPPSVAGQPSRAGTRLWDLGHALTVAGCYRPVALSTASSTWTGVPGRGRGGNNGACRRVEPVSPQS